MVGYDDVKKAFGYTSHSTESCAWPECSSERVDLGLCWIHKNYGNSKQRARKQKARLDF